MNVDEFKALIFKKSDYHPDIILLKNRLLQLYQLEEFEKMSVLKSWIDELIVKHNKKKII